MLAFDEMGLGSGMSLMRMGMIAATFIAVLIAIVLLGRRVAALETAAQSAPAVAVQRLAIQHPGMQPRHNGPAEAAAERPPPAPAMPVRRGGERAAMAREREAKAFAQAAARHTARVRPKAPKANTAFRKPPAAEPAPAGAAPAAFMIMSATSRPRPPRPSEPKIQEIVDEPQPASGGSSGLDSELEEELKELEEEEA